MKGLKNSKKRWINFILLLIGIGIIVYYSVCEESCAYLKGTIFGIELKYLGLFYMGMLIAFNFLKRELIILSLLSLGIGAEIYLIGFQIVSGEYCYYCLGFGAVVVFLFILNFKYSKKAIIGISIITGFILFVVLFKGMVTPVYADEIVLPSFGNGKIEIRLYTDYFCGPCRALEPKLEPLIKDLLKKDIINIIFIDTPVHTHTKLYSRFFLYSLKEKKEINHVLRVRTVLFEAAKNKITEQEKLEEFLKNKKIRLKPFDVTTTLNIYSSFIKEDKINATPTCVIFKGNKKETFKGYADILKTFESLR
ncbi:MAG: thioredoxin domain-containing protein [Nitrospirota bacterium]|nr:thioredoxin domain-containing protein [Nitrospirota bacterium]MDH5768486.1 thioredoxin domain-containing protein [Nitrospirota bacterium]